MGSQIGVIGVTGNPAEDGDIKLTLNEENAPIKIEPGSKNITLIQQLDKEVRLNTDCVGEINNCTFF